MADSALRIWINGRRFDDPTEANLPVTDHGFVVGNGIFESLKVTDAGVFATERHLARMTRSARALGLPEPDHDAVREGIAAVIEGRPYDFGKIRITYTGGPGPLGSGAPYGEPTLVVAADVAELPAPTADVVTAPWLRNERGALAGVKSTSYAENVRALAYAHEHDACEAVFFNTAGRLCEGTGSNVFLVFGAETVTPPLSAGPLAGITREQLLEWTDVTEADVSEADAARADEVFLTSSMRDVQAVRSWDGVVRDAPGAQTHLLAKIFAERATDEIDP